MYQEYNEHTASPEDKVAWGLCQIIDDDAPLNWTRYRFVARCIASNHDIMDSLMSLSVNANGKKKRRANIATGRHSNSRQIT